MPSFGDTGVAWEVVSREFRAKYSDPPAESASLKAAQAVIDEMLPQFKAIPGFVDARRAVFMSGKNVVDPTKAKYSYNRWKFIWFSHIISISTYKIFVVL